MEVKARYNEGAASLMVSAILEDANFNRLRKSGLRHLGRRYDAEVHEEIRPDAFCGRRSG